MSDERKTPTVPMSLRAFAALPEICVFESAIRRAVQTGRLERSIGRDRKGRAVIVDVALAIREFHDNRDPSRGQFA